MPNDDTEDLKKELNNYVVKMVQAEAKIDNL